MILPLVAVVVLRERSLEGAPEPIGGKKQALIVLLAAFLIGGYDGFYGPGAGTFLLLAFCKLGRLELRTAAGNVKLVNLALATSFTAGKVFVALGLIAGLASIAGHYLGSGLAIKNGSKIVRPVILLMLGLLAVKVVTELF